MVMGEMKPRRQTRLLVRGRYDQPGEAVTLKVWRQGRTLTLRVVPQVLR